MLELKPCPFCGSEANLYYVEGKRYYFVLCECEVCGAKTKSFLIGREIDEKTWFETLPAHRAIEAWNRRKEDA